MLARFVGLGIAGAASASLALASDGSKDKDQKSEERNQRAMFDPEALERGAKALREINKSPFAKNVSGRPPLERDLRNPSHRELVSLVFMSFDVHINHREMHRGLDICMEISDFPALPRCLTSQGNKR
jgi:hypothetical protein